MTPTGSTHDVFISYSTVGNDKVIADAVCAKLENEKIRCWIAPRDIIAGTNWGGAIVDAISRSRIFVLVFSNNSNESQQVLHEVERAVSKGIPVLPFRVEDVTPSTDMEFYLGATHWLDAITPPMEKHIQKLAEIIKTLLGAQVSWDEEADDLPLKDESRGPSLGEVAQAPSVGEVTQGPPVGEVTQAPSVSDDALEPSGEAGPTSPLVQEVTPAPSASEAVNTPAVEASSPPPLVHQDALAPPIDEEIDLSDTDLWPWSEEPSSNKRKLLRALALVLPVVVIILIIFLPSDRSGAQYAVMNSLFLVAWLSSPVATLLLARQAGYEWHWWVLFSFLSIATISLFLIVMFFIKPMPRKSITHYRSLEKHYRSLGGSNQGELAIVLARRAYIFHKVGKQRDASMSAEEALSIANKSGMSNLVRQLRELLEDIRLTIVKK